MIFPRCVRPMSHPARDRMEVDLGRIEDACSEVSSVTALDFDDDDSISLEMLGTPHLRIEELSSGRSLVDYRERSASTLSSAVSLGKSTSHASKTGIRSRKLKRLKFNSSLDMSSSCATSNTFIGSSSSFSYEHNAEGTPQSSQKPKCSVSTTRDLADSTKDKKSSLYFI